MAANQKTRAEAPNQISLTELIQQERFKRYFLSRMPQTRGYITDRNRKNKSALVVPPSEWTSANRHWIVGLATEYTVALDSGAEGGLADVLERAARWVQKAPMRGLGTVMHLMSSALRASSQANAQAQAADRTRLLCLLAELDAAFRSGRCDLTWLRPEQINSQKELVQVLAEHYPREVVDEIGRCADNTLEDLPPFGACVYGPVFSRSVGALRIYADGDFLLDRCLVDVKTNSKGGLTSAHIWQVFGYAMLDSLRPDARVNEVAIYNPRYRVRWRESTETLAQGLGRKPFRELADSLLVGLAAEAARTM